MKRFLKKIFLLCALIATSLAVMFVIICIYPDHQDGYYAALIDKHERLNSTTPPRIILVGGSSFAFGSKSDVLEKKTGYPVTNLGLYGGFGPHFMLTDAKRFIQKGDIVIVSLEHEEYHPNVIDGGEEMVNLITTYPESILSLSTFAEYKNIFSHILMFLKSDIRKIENAVRGHAADECSDPIYCRRLFNKFGDANNSNIATATKKFTATPITIDTPNKDTIKAVGEFSEYATKKGVTVIYSFPPIAESFYLQKEMFITEMEKSLRPLPNIIFVDNSKDYVFPDELFLDTPHHLNARGRDKKMDIFLERILPAIPTKKIIGPSIVPL